MQEKLLGEKTEVETISERIAKLESELARERQNLIVATRPLALYQNSALQVLLEGEAVRFVDAHNGLSLTIAKDIFLKVAGKLTMENDG